MKYVCGYTHRNRLMLFCQKSTWTVTRVIDEEIVLQPKNSSHE